MAASLDLSQPFVLFDDARAVGGAQARLYQCPETILETSNLDEIPAFIQHLKGGDWAGFLAYEAGCALESKLAKFDRAADIPLFWFAKFAKMTMLDPMDVGKLLPNPSGGWIGKPQPIYAYGDYSDSFTKVKNYIKDGDIYQANLTFPCKISLSGHPLAIYAGLRQRAQAGYCAVVWTGKDWFLSLSPELFFALKDGKLTTKPMKGTATRRANVDADEAAKNQLKADSKQRAENLMIVDLLRNDLSRVSVKGSVEVPELFKVETYPTVHQMISTVTATLQPEADVRTVLSTIFPCGSITGAPKIRAMEVINEVEHQARGIYTGAIGRIDTNGDAAFNVAIRTLHLREGDDFATLGLGSGVVADSQMEEEWRECLAKGRFVADPRSLDLIETMRFDPESGIAHLDKHLNRMKASATQFGFEFDRHVTRNDLQAATFMQTTSCRVRLLLGPSGQTAIQLSPLAPQIDGIVDVKLVDLPVDPADFRLRHKTSDRQFYAHALDQAGSFEVALVHPDGCLTEGSFTNIFVDRDGVLLTPPLSRGLLPGILRAHLLEIGKAQEADLYPNDLQNGFMIGNATRGLLPAKLI